MGVAEEYDGERDPIALAAYLRGAAIELLRGRNVEPEGLAPLLEASAAALLEKAAQPRKPPSPGVERLAQIKTRYRRAYERWTEEEDALLRQQHAEGRSVADIGKSFERQPSAIRSRLQRLGCNPADEVAL